MLKVFCGCLLLYLFTFARMRLHGWLVVDLGLPLRICMNSCMVACVFTIAQNLDLTHVGPCFGGLGY